MLNCPSCGRQWKYLRQHRGKELCPKCIHEVRVKDADRHIQNADKLITKAEDLLVKFDILLKELEGRKCFVTPTVLARTSSYVGKTK